MTGPAAPTTRADTAAAGEFADWLNAFNSGDRQRLHDFLAEHLAPLPDGTTPADAMTDRQSSVFRSSGGLEVRKLTTPAAGRVTAFVQTRRMGYWIGVGLTVSPEPPHKIMGFGFRNIMAPPELLPAERLSDDEIRRRTDDLVSKLVDADQFSGVILVARDGKTIYERASGLANRAWNAPNRIDTKFNVASIGKMFTAVAVAQLVERGKLSFDDTLATALPSYPNKDIAAKVTIRHLLTHTSGIDDNRTSMDKLVATLRQRNRKIKDYLSTAANDTLKFDPGSKLEYSNYSYWLLGAVIEQASGQDYYDYVRANVLAPAGMTNTDSVELDTDPTNLATGYMDAPGGGPRRSNIFYLPVKGVPSGLGYSTAGDMVRFAEALRAHELLNAQSLETMWTAGQLPYTEPDSRYGFGCIVTQYNNTRIIGHGGGWFGITNKFDVYPELGYTVIIFNNIDSDPNALAFRLREWLTQRAAGAPARSTPITR
jgi:CubicO group peptidase (beta-lactamase class C family)